jgi:hypothetical protein
MERGRIYPGNFSEEVSFCDFCSGKKELDWVEMIIGNDEDPWKYIDWFKK